MTWLDTAGVAHRVLDRAGRSATVLLFISPDCPVSNAYAPEIVRIEKKYREQNVSLFAVHADPRVTAADAKEHATSFGYTFPVLLDPKQTLAHSVGANATPEAVVLNPAGEVVYRGRIDDLFFGFGKRRSVTTHYELRDAIDATLAGKRLGQVDGPSPVGCEIPPGE